MYVSYICMQRECVCSYHFLGGPHPVIAFKRYFNPELDEMSLAIRSPLRRSYESLFPLCRILGDTRFPTDRVSGDVTQHLLLTHLQLDVNVTSIYWFIG